MNEKLLRTLVALAREYPNSIEKVLQVAYATGKLDGSMAKPVEIGHRYTQPEQPEVA